MFKKITSKLASLNMRIGGGKIVASALMMLAMTMVAQSAQATVKTYVRNSSPATSWYQVVDIDWDTEKIVVECDKNTLVNPSAGTKTLIAICPYNESDESYKLDWAGKGCTLVYRDNMIYSWNGSGSDPAGGTSITSTLWNSSTYLFEFTKDSGVKFNGTTIRTATNTRTDAWGSRMKVGAEGGAVIGGTFKIVVMPKNETYSSTKTNANFSSTSPATGIVKNILDDNYVNNVSGGWNKTVEGIDWSTQKIVMSLNQTGFANGKEVVGFNLPGGDVIGWGRANSICFTCSGTTAVKAEWFNGTGGSAGNSTVNNSNGTYLVEISTDGVKVNNTVAVAASNSQLQRILGQTSLKIGCTNNQVGYTSYYLRVVNKEGYAEATTTTSNILDETKVPSLTSNAFNVNVQLKRSLDNTGWNTFCVPFYIDAATIASKFGEGTQLRTFSSMEGTTMNFVAATEIEAGKPYLIKPGNAEVPNPTFEGVDIVAGDPTAVGSDGYQMVGTYGLKTLTTDGTNLFLGDGDKFFMPEDESKATMKGMRAYFVVPSGANYAALVANIDGTETAIDQIEGAKVVENPNAPVYNLNGQRVGNSLNSLSRGVYIQNGKKYVVK